MLVSNASVRCREEAGTPSAVRVNNSAQAKRMFGFIARRRFYRERDNGLTLSCAVSDAFPVTDRIAQPRPNRVEDAAGIVWIFTAPVSDFRLRNGSVCLFRERVWSRLELHNLGPRALAAFLMPGRVHRIARPEPATLPAGIRVVYPSRPRSSGESQRIWHAQRQGRHLTALRHHDEERVYMEVTRQHHVLPET